MKKRRQGRRASITDLACTTTDADFHVVEINHSGAIIRHFTHPQHAAVVIGGKMELVTQREIKAACEAELLGIKSNIQGRRVAWAARYEEPEDAEVELGEKDEAMKQRLMKMKEIQNRGRPTEPEPEPEHNPNETLADVRAENAAAAIEIKRLRQELERIESGAADDSQVDQELEELSEQQDRVNNTDASLDTRLREMAREHLLADNQLKLSKALIREKDAELRKMRTALREAEARAASEAQQVREMEVETQVMRARRQTAAKTMKQLESKIVISKANAQRARQDAVEERKLEATNRQALETARRGLAGKDKDGVALEEAALAKEIEAEMQRRAAIRHETKETRKQLVRKERELVAKEAELATKLAQAHNAQRVADAQFLEGQQLFDHSNLVLAAQSRRMSELARRRASAEHRLASISPRRDGADQKQRTTSPARSPAASDADAGTSPSDTRSPSAHIGGTRSGTAVAAPSPAPLAGAGGAVASRGTPLQKQQLPPAPQSPLRAGLHVLVRQKVETSSADAGTGEQAIREGRVMQVSPNRERCTVVFSDGDVAQDIPIELVERQHRELETIPKLQRRFASEKTLDQKVAEKRQRARGRKVQLAGSGAAAAQATLIKYAPSLSFLRVLSTTERMQYFQEEASEDKPRSDGATVDRRG